MRQAVGGRWHRALGAALLLLAVLGVLAPSPARAAENGAWSLLPTGGQGTNPRSHFTLDLKPGQAVTESVTLANLTDAPTTFRLYTADAFNTDPDGVFSLRRIDDKDRDVGAWTKLPDVGEITLGGRQKVDIPFTVTVPAKATAGDHAGGIVAMSTTPQQGQQGNVNVDVLRAVGVRIYVRVSGRVAPELAIQRLTLRTTQPLVPYLTGKGSGSLTYTVRNRGNTRVTPAAEIELDSTFDGKSTKIPVRQLPELLPGASITITERLPSIDPAGWMRATLTVTAPGVDTVRKSTRAVLVPWLALAVLILVIGFVVYRALRKDPPPVEDDGPAEPSDEPVGGGRSRRTRTSTSAGSSGQ